MELTRMACYTGAVLMAAALVGQLLRIRHQLARLMAVVMIAWAVNAVMLLMFLYYDSTQGYIPDWRGPVKTVNAALLFLVPAVLYGWFLRMNGHGHHDT